MCIYLSSLWLATLFFLLAYKAEDFTSINQPQMLPATEQVKLYLGGWKCSKSYEEHSLFKYPTLQAACINTEGYYGDIHA